MNESDSTSAASNALCVRTGRWAFYLLLLVMVGQGVARIAFRSIPDALQGSADLRSPYLSSRAWGQGIDPYSRENIAAEWEQVRPAGSRNLVETDWLWFPSLYPPSTLAMIYPLTFIPWAVVRVGWVIANVLICVAACLAMIRILNLSWSDRRAQFLGAAFISLGPLVTCLRTANPTIIAVMLCVLVLYFVRFDRPIMAGIILGIAVTLKPQLAGAVLIVFILQLRPRICVPAIAVAVFFVLLGVGRLWISHANWIPSLHGNLAMSTGPGRINDASRLNPEKWSMLNLQVPLFEIFSNRHLVDALAWGTVAALCVVFLVIWKRSSQPIENILLVGVPLAVCLLPIYHRYYDALVLIFPLGWAIAHFGTPKWRHAWAIFLCTAPFYVSSAFVLESLKRSRFIPSSLNDSPLLNVCLMPIETWGLIFIAIIIMHRMWLDNTPPAYAVPSKPGPRD